MSLKTNVCLGELNAPSIEIHIKMLQQKGSGALSLQAMSLQGVAQPLGGGAEWAGAVPEQFNGEIGYGRERLIRQAHHIATGQGFGE